MPATNTMRGKLDYLVRMTGRSEAEIVAEAVEEGLADLYARKVADAYAAGEINRDQAVAELGETVVDDIDFARRAVARDVQWGLTSG